MKCVCLSFRDGPFDFLGGGGGGGVVKNILVLISLKKNWFRVTEKKNNIFCQ